MNIYIAAEESAGIQALRLVASKGHRVSAVLTSAPEGVRGATVAGVAERLGVRVLPARLVKDPALAGQMRDEGVELLLNIHSLHIVHADVLVAPTIGSFNLHPGPLPAYAGRNVPSWAIAAGERRHAVTLHWMAPEVDAGHIAFATEFDIEPDDTGLSLSAKCVRHGLPLVNELIERASEDPSSIPAVAQEESKRRYFGRRPPYDGWVPWQLEARRVVDFVRACDYGPWPSPWGEARARAGALEVAVCSTRLAGRPVPPGTAPGSVRPDPSGGDGVLVAAADEWVLVQRVRYNGKRVAPQTVLRPGLRLELSWQPGRAAFPGGDLPVRTWHADV
jgi:UDP-4-amino-4-deoxy-L-arabinose formyltransferase/UDP-glucuronic acid dehydrogenase (UDP-4-keto-hexauronic acid decarboxylating)